MRQDLQQDQGSPLLRLRSPETLLFARITSRYITKYEKARVLGTRALQIRYLALQMK